MKTISIIYAFFLIIDPLSNHSVTEKKEPRTLSWNDMAVRLDTPFISKKWKRIVYYPENHLNDFCVFQDLKGVWHALGIKGTGTWDSEQSLFHASSDRLFSLFTNHNDILTEKPPKGQLPQKHAPYVVVRDSIYYLFYRRPPGTTMLTQSKNPYSWPELGQPIFSREDARDVCIQQFNDEYYMYYCQFSMDSAKKGVSTIMLRKSKDLLNWGSEIVVHTDTQQECRHSYLESPFVIERDNLYYLFIRHRLYNKDEKTVVYCSTDPEKFPSGTRQWFTEISHAHAGEIIKYKGKFYLIRVSGAPHANPEKGLKDKGWLEINRLRWK